MTAITTAPTATAPKAMSWAGWALCVLVTLFLLMDGVMKLLQLPIVVSTTTQLGFSAASVVPIGTMVLIIAVLYAIPRTSVLGAVLMTGLYGGTVATHVLAGNPLFSHVLFGVYLGVAAWAGLWLRDPQVRAVMPLRR